MARNLEELQKQYNSSALHDKKSMSGGFRGKHGGNPGIKGKPKNVKHTIRRLLSYVKPYSPILVLVVVFMFLNTLTSLVGGYLLSPIINKLSGTVDTSSSITIAANNAIQSFTKLLSDSVLSAFGLGAEDSVLVYVLAGIILMMMIYLIGIATSYLQSRLMLIVTQGSIEKIRNDLFTKLQKLPVKYYDENSTGEIMSRFTNDVDNISQMLDNTLVSLVSGVITLIGTMIFMLSTSWILSLVTFAFVPVYLFGGAFIAGKSRKYYSSAQNALGAVNGYIEETVSGQKVVKVFNHEDECSDEFELLNNDMRNKQFKAQFFGGIMGPVMGNTGQMCYGITVGIGGILMLTTSFTPGALTVFATYSRRFSMPINSISQLTSTVFAALAGAERVFSVMDMQPEAEDKKEASDMPGMKGYVKLENVTFGYNSDKTILKNISLYAKPGQKIAFVGSTGAGKTTITNLINRFYDIQEGSITIDGTDIRDIKRNVLRSNIAMVLQETHLFTGTIMENIRYGRLDATDDEVIEAAKTASADSFIMRLENGYQTMLQGDGANLSQGQRQLLNIARAAISKAPILILDEATSSVDTRTEMHIEQGMDKLMSDRTTFVIAHRLSTVRNSNAIMVLENGVIIERGTHEELLALGGRYYELYTGKRELD